MTTTIRLSTKAKLTKRVLDDARHPDPTIPSKSGFFIWDTELRGFAVRVSTAGRKVFIIEWRLPAAKGVATPKGRYVIGEFGNPYTIDQAREIARGVQAKAKLGINPNQERRDDARRTVDLAFDKMADRFVSGYARLHQTRSYGQAERTLNRDVKPVLGSKPLHAITRADIGGLLADIAGKAPQQARYTQATLRKFFRWAVDVGQLDQSPMIGMAPITKVAASRDRVLVDDELREIWLATETLGEPFASIYRLLMATGQRREEVASMAWSQIDLPGRTWTIPTTHAKNKKAHIVPLNELAMEVIDGLSDKTWGGRDAKADLLFSTNGETAPSGWSKAKRRCDSLILANRLKAAQENGKAIDKIKSMTGWRVHDFRRTMATGFQRLGVRLEVTEAALNHVGGSRAGIVGIYQRYDWESEKRAAMDTWSEHLAGVIADRPASTNVVPMRQRSKA